MEIVDCSSPPSKDVDLPDDETVREDFLAAQKTASLSEAAEWAAEDTTAYLQESDPFLEDVYQALKAGQLCPEFVLEEGILFHVSKQTRWDEPRLQLTIPDIMIPKLMEAYHNYNGHFGIDKTHDIICCRFYWDGQYKSVVEYIQNCVACNKKQLKRIRAQLQEMPIPEHPFEMVVIDLAVPFLMMVTPTF